MQNGSAGPSSLRKSSTATEAPVSAISNTDGASIGPDRAPRPAAVSPPALVAGPSADEGRSAHACSGSGHLNSAAPQHGSARPEAFGGLASFAGAESPSRPGEQLKSAAIPMSPIAIAAAAEPAAGQTPEPQPTTDFSFGVPAASASLQDAAAGSGQDLGVPGASDGSPVAFQGFSFGGPARCARCKFHGSLRLCSLHLNIKLCEPTCSVNLKRSGMPPVLACHHTHFYIVHMLRSS